MANFGFVSHAHLPGGGCCAPSPPPSPARNDCMSCDDDDADPTTDAKRHAPGGTWPTPPPPVAEPPNVDGGATLPPALQVEGGGAAVPPTVDGDGSTVSPSRLRRSALALLPSSKGVRVNLPAASMPPAVLKPLKNAKNFAPAAAFCLRRRLRRAFLPPAAPAAGFGLRRRDPTLHQHTRQLPRGSWGPRAAMAAAGKGVRVGGQHLWDTSSTLQQYVAYY